jgi:hypothetical protein
MMKYITHYRPAKRFDVYGMMEMAVYGFLAGLMFGIGLFYVFT